ARAKALVALLRRELDTEPEPATTALIEEIKQSTIAQAARADRPTPNVVIPKTDADHTDPLARAPSTRRAADTPPMADRILEPEAAAGAPDRRWKIPQVWLLAALAGVVALAILASRLWLLAPGQSVSASTGHQSQELLPPGRTDEPAVDVLIARGWAAHNRGWTLENLTEAMAAFQAAQKRDDDLLDAMLGIAAVSTSLAINHFESAPYLDQAENLLRRALRKKPDDPTVLFHSGRLHLARGQYEAALSELARALERIQVDHPQGIHLSAGKPSLAYLRAVMGHTLVRSGRATEGIAHIRHAIELRPYTPHIGKWYAFAGEAELELGQTEAALEWLLRALAVLPSGNVLVHQALAAAYALRGDDANAAKHAAELRRIVPEARITAFCKQYPARLREGLLRALELSNRNKQL
ncbi:MAG TPA: tetratricopeptide repeat protein, partial [Lysobacter sp.]|nr:tetratricopeptide repeat protein [Lysobacter sp.]